MPNPEGSQGRQWLVVTTRCSPRCSTTNPRPSPTLRHRAFGLYRSGPHLRGKLLRCFSHFRPEPFMDVAAVLGLRLPFALFLLPQVTVGEYLRLFGFHHFVNFSQS